MSLLTRHKSLHFNYKTVYLALRAGRISMVIEIFHVLEGKGLWTKDLYHYFSHQYRVC